MNHTALKQADIHNFDCLYDYNNSGFYLCTGGGGVGEGSFLPKHSSFPPKISLIIILSMCIN